MILLETANVIVRNLIQDWFNNDGKPFDILCADFDGAAYKVTADKGNTLTVSFKAPAADSLLKQGGKDYLAKVYGPNLISPASGFDVTLSIPFNTSPNERAALALRCASLKSYLFASILLIRMEAASKSTVVPGLVDIALRSQKERMFVRQDGTDRITVIFSIEFQAHNDSVIGQVFCNEFANKDAQGSASPTVSYSPKPPSELKDIKNLPAGERISYLTFVIYDRHWKGSKMETSAFTIVSFRNYLHYHLKCCKSYLHTRMRTRVDNLLKVLNRAKQETSSQKKTATGRTFTRK